MKVKKIFIIFTLFIINSCDKDCINTNVVNKKQNESFYCYINGQYWTPKIYSNGFSGGEVYEPVIDYYQEDSILVINANNMEKNEIIKFSAKIFKVGNYNLKRDCREISLVSISNDTLLYEFKTRFEQQYMYSFAFFLVDSINSQLLITNFDTVKKVIKGSFFFDLENINGEIKSIKSGNFNFRYNNLN